MGLSGTVFGAQEFQPLNSDPLLAFSLVPRGSGFRVQTSGFRVSGLGLRVRTMEVLE